MANIKEIIFRNGSFLVLEKSFPGRAENIRETSQSWSIALSSFFFTTVILSNIVAYLPVTLSAGISLITRAFSLTAVSEKAAQISPYVKLYSKIAAKKVRLHNSVKPDFLN